MGFVDLHAHVLPALDDGAPSAADAVGLVKLLGQIGFEVVHATPHQRVGAWVPSGEAIAEAHALLRSQLPPGGPSVRLGAENMWDELFLERGQKNEVPAYRAGPASDGEPRRAFLFELPIAHLPPRLEEQLFALRRKGPLPVMAHPERYAGLWGDAARFEGLAQRVALVVDLAALDGAHGAKQAKTARWLCERGLAHAAASDIHKLSDGRAIAAGIAWINKRLGGSAVTRLLDSGPRQILNGELPV